MYTTDENEVHTYDYPHTETEVRELQQNIAYGQTKQQPEDNGAYEETEQQWDLRNNAAYEQVQSDQPLKTQGNVDYEQIGGQMEMDAIYKYEYTEIIA